MTISLDEWDYELPPDRIARFPTPERDGSRLMHLHRSGIGSQHLPDEAAPADHSFSDLPDLLRPNDLLIVNDSRVMPARLYSTRKSGGQTEVLVLEPGPGPVRALLRPARRLRVGERLTLRSGASATFLGRSEEEGVFLVDFDGDLRSILDAEGEIPLPPYLEREATAADVERYQTIYAGPLGSSAAPTAGLHFTERVFSRLAERGIGVEKVTLHVGVGTFRPLRDEDLASGRLHSEPCVVSEATVQAILRARASGGRVIAVGTTTTRAIESAARDGTLKSGSFDTDLIITPGYEYRVIDGLVTNFHLPRSSLLLLVAALLGRTRTLDAYATAVAKGYRFYSYGDAMLIL